MTVSVKVEFLGGLDSISLGRRQHRCVVPGDEGEATLRDLLSVITSTLIPDPQDVSVFLQDDTVRPGILVLINDTDWELEGMEDYLLQNGDTCTFTSTLHGG